MPIIPVVKSKGMSAVIRGTICECNQCGFQWIPQTKREPERCPSRKCRSVAWNRPKLKKGEKLKRGPVPAKKRKK